MFKAVVADLLRVNWYWLILSLRLFDTNVILSFVANRQIAKGPTSSVRKYAILVLYKSSKWPDWPKIKGLINVLNYVLGPIVQFQQKEQVAWRREMDEIPGHGSGLSCHSCLQSSMFDFEHPQSSRVRIDTAAMLEVKCWLKANMQRSAEKLASSRRTTYPSLQSQQLRTKESELDAPNVCHYVKHRWTMHINWTNLASAPTGEGDYFKRLTYGYLHLPCRT
jgi:hypothetical protein